MSGEIFFKIFDFWIFSNKFKFKIFSYWFIISLCITEFNCDDFNGVRVDGNTKVSKLEYINKGHHEDKLDRTEKTKKIWTWLYKVSIHPL